ncbi:hypothetical protein [Erwinia persicina]|nr:hypothetical protein [Erwinia persicina]MCQ4092770.1 hypothetical protein [Erwinia persicina]MCQ4100623.1 hypothetical protein [Erwinia persicina]MCQ4105248.1 hypothetical protein [Erwinia persicina]UTX11458.1 hypothetical protein NOG67_13745 [Erwinia persicina]
MQEVVMPGLSKGSIVRHKTGQIEGVVLNVFVQGSRCGGYYIQWDDGNHSYHTENELIRANTDRPRLNDTPRSAK